MMLVIAAFFVGAALGALAIALCVVGSDEE